MLRRFPNGPADFVVIKFLLPSQRLKVCRGGRARPCPATRSYFPSNVQPDRPSPDVREPRLQVLSAPGLVTAPSTLPATRGEGRTLGVTKGLQLCSGLPGGTDQQMHRC